VNNVDIGANFCKRIEKKPLFTALYSILNAVLKVSAQAGHCGALNKTSVESTAHDFQEVRCKMHISNNTSQTAKNSTKPVPTSAAVEIPPKVVLTRNFFSPLRTTGMDMETTDAEDTLPEQEAPRKSGRPPPIMTSTMNLIRTPNELKDHVKGQYESQNTLYGTRITTNKHNRPLRVAVQGLIRPTPYTHHNK
jgi:hypothetical protein